MASMTKFSGLLCETQTFHCINCIALSGFGDISLFRRFVIPKVRHSELSLGFVIPKVRYSEYSIRLVRYFEYTEGSLFRIELKRHFAEIKLRFAIPKSHYSDLAYM